VARLSFEAGDFFTGIAKAKAAMKGLGGDMKIDTSGLTAAAAKVEALKTSLSGLSANVKVNTDGLGSLAAKTAATAAVTQRATGIMINGWRLTGTAIHWIIAGGAELLAVTLPALVALGAAAAVQLQGWVNVGQHVEAVYTATEATANMFHVTAGQAMGLGHALQAAQDAANPAVYGMLGSAIITVNEHFGNLAQTGLDVTHIMQTFAAKVAVDFGPGGALGSDVNSLLAHMTTDLTGIGQLFGNLGRGIASFAAQMPGLAEVLLGMLSGLAGFVAKGIEFAGSLKLMGVSVLTMAMGFEEFNRWGGLAAQVLTRFGVASASLEGGVFSFTRFASVVRGLASVLPAVTTQVAVLAEKIGAAGAANGLASFADSLESVISKIGPVQALIGVGLAVGVGVLVDKLLTATNAAQQFGNSLRSALLKGSNINALQTIDTNVAQLNQKLKSTPAALNGTAQEMMRFGTAMQTVNPEIASYNAAISQQKQDLANVATGAAYLAKTYGTTLYGALALADLANVKLANGITGSGQAAMVARMQIASLVQGYQAMGQSSGEVGADMTALAIQSGLAASKVADLNQAWDQFQGNLVGGTSGLASFVNSLKNVGSVVASVKNNLGKGSGISDSVRQFAESLKSFGTSGATAWQNFDQIVGSTAPQLIDWMRTAGTEGALSAGQFKQAGLDMVSALVPLASASKTAQAEVLGLVQQIDPSIQTWSQLGAAVKNSGASMTGLGSIIGGATQKMANMQSVAQTLGDVLNSALLSALSAATVQASGAGAAMQTYAQDLMTSGAAASATAGARQAVVKDLEALGLNAQQAASMINQVTQSLAGVHSKTVTLTVITNSISSGGGPPVGVGIPGHAAGTPAAAPGWAWVGEAGPELVKFRGGETVVPNSVATGYAGGAGDFGSVHQVNVFLDGKQIYSGMQKEAATTQRRTGHNGLSRRSR
jgi:hypothetical protein